MDSNNKLGNLTWGTREENTEDKFRHGTTRKGLPGSVSGEKHGMAKLTVDRVLEVRALHATGTMSTAAIGRKFGVTQAHASGIIHRKFWKTV